jgi:hypothetical protein
MFIDFLVVINIIFKAKKFLKNLFSISLDFIYNLDYLEEFNFN